MIIGITGKYCAGKTTLTHVFLQKGFYKIDVDTVGHKVLQEKRKNIVAVFGSDIESISNGVRSVNRKKLGKIVFANSKKLCLLETIVHPLMIKYVQDALYDNKDKNIIICSTLLYSMSLYNLCNKIVIVHAPYIVRFLRALRRDKLNVIQVLQRFFIQRKLFSRKIIKVLKENAEIFTVRGIQTQKQYHGFVNSLIS